MSRWTAAPVVRDAKLCTNPPTQVVRLKHRGRRATIEVKLCTACLRNVTRNLKPPAPRLPTVGQVIARRGVEAVDTKGRV